MTSKVRATMERALTNHICPILLLKPHSEVAGEACQSYTTGLTEFAERGRATPYEKFTRVGSWERTFFYRLWALGLAIGWF